MFTDVLGTGSLDEKVGDGLVDFQQQSRNADRRARQQVRRQVRLAVWLANRLDNEPASSARVGTSIAATTSARFAQEAYDEAASFAKKDPSVKRFLVEIGWVYQHRAESYLAGQKSKFGRYGFKSLKLRLRRRGREASQKATTVKLALSSCMKLRKIVNEADALANASDAPEPSSEMPSAISNALPTFMETLWSLTAHDIRDTLDKVAQRVLADESVSVEMRQCRAERLYDLGASFSAAARARDIGMDDGKEAAATVESQTASQDNENARSRKRFEDAFIASMNSSSGYRPPE